MVQLLGFQQGVGGGGEDHEFPPPPHSARRGLAKENTCTSNIMLSFQFKKATVFQHKQFKLFFPTFRSQVPNETLMSEDQSLNI